MKEDELKLPEDLEFMITKIIREYSLEHLTKEWVILQGLTYFDILFPIEEKPKFIQDWIIKKIMERRFWETEQNAKKMKKGDN